MGMTPLTQNCRNRRHGYEFEVGNQDAGQDVQKKGTHHGGDTTRCACCDNQVQELENAR